MEYTAPTPYLKIFTLTQQLKPPRNNNKNLYSTIIKQFWSTTNILQYSNLIIDRKNKYSTNFKIIQLLQHLNIQIDIHSSII